MNMLLSMPMILTPVKEATNDTGRSQELSVAQDTDATNNLTVPAQGPAFICSERGADEPEEATHPTTSPSFADPEISSSFAETVLVPAETECIKPPGACTGIGEPGKKKGNNHTTAGKPRSANSAKKKSKHIRDVESHLKLLAPEKEDTGNIKAFGFAQAYFVEVSDRLKGKDDDLYQEFLQTMDNFGKTIFTVPELYLQITNIFQRHPELATEFLAFLLPEQAMECGKFMEHHIQTRMRDFLRMLEVHFTKQPLQIQKVCACLTSLSNQSNVTVEDVRSSVIPLLKGNSLLIDTFLQLLPIEQPPNSLVCEFEDLVCGNTDDEFETVEVPDPGDVYGGDQCACVCHQNGNDKYQKRDVHCVSCSIKFMHGKVFLQTGKALRPAKVSFGDDPSNFRRRLNSEEHPKKCNRKRTVNANRENNLKKFQTKENTSPKSSKMCKSKTPHKKIIDKEGKESVIEKSKTSFVPPTSDERVSSHEVTEKCVENDRIPSCNMQEQTGHSQDITVIYPAVEESMPSQESCAEKVHVHKAAVSQDHDPDLDMEVDIESGSEACSDPGTILSCSQKVSLWTKEEDKIILQMFQADLQSEQTFSKISQHLPQRSIHEIQDRFHTLMELLERMTGVKVSQSLTK